MQEWISVKDKLPEQFQTVIACAYGDRSDKAVYVFPGMIGHTQWEDFSDVDFAGCYEWMEHVTHWMPLPEPPQ